MDAITITLLVLAILAIAGWGLGSFAARPAPVVVSESAPVATGSPLLSLLGIVGLILLVAFIVLLLTGWRFGLQVQAPHAP